MSHNPLPPYKSNVKHARCVPHSPPVGEVRCRQPPVARWRQASCEPAVPVAASTPVRCNKGATPTSLPVKIVPEHSEQPFSRTRGPRGSRQNEHNSMTIAGTSRSDLRQCNWNLGRPVTDQLRMTRLIRQGRVSPHSNPPVNPSRPSELQEAVVSKRQRPSLIIRGIVTLLGRVALVFVG